MSGNRVPIIVVALLAVSIASVVAACGGGNETGGKGTTATDAGTNGCVQKVDAALADLQSGGVLSEGPNGEDPVSGTDIELTDEELAKIKKLNATAAISLHFSGNDWSNAQVAGAKSQFAKMGIKVGRVTDAQGRPEKQVSDIETIMAQQPDVLLSIPIDPVATARAYKDAAAKGVKIVFMDLPAAGMKAGGEGGYVSTVSADNYGNGVAAAHILARELGCKGKVGIVRFAQDFYVTNLRVDGVKATLEKDYPDIEIVSEKQAGAPDFGGNSEKAASAMLTQYPTLDGMWAFFDIPAEGVVSAARTAGRDDLVVTTSDLGLTIAIRIAKGEWVAGLGSQRPFDQGVTEAMLAGYALIGKEAPAYVALPPLAVTKANVLDAWTEVYHVPAPKQLQDAAR